ncbi:MIP family Ig-specific serine endopeptidase [Mycoplasma corogypsi]|uniref:MIP family Ig-specific serine endopeptidase n=1 Tax=Mycoplasma corogypsi TaxID=2106 RepID=UPI0038739E88
MKLKKMIMASSSLLLASTGLLVSCNKSVEVKKPKDEAQAQTDAKIQSSIDKTLTNTIENRQSIENTLKSRTKIEQNIGVAELELNSKMQQKPTLKAELDAAEAKYQAADKAYQTQVLVYESASSSEKEAANNKLVELTNERDVAYADWNEKKTSYEELIKEIDGLEIKISKYKSDIHSTKGKIARLQKDIAKNNKEIEANRSKLGQPEPAKPAEEENAGDNNEIVRVPDSGNPPTFDINNFPPNNRGGASPFAELSTYPSYASAYTEIPAKELYKEIWDRTFSLKYGFNENDYDEHGQPKVFKVREGSQGTAWLLDYHKNKNNNKIKLFLATNLHVLGNFSNALPTELLKKFNYDDPSGNSVFTLSLGKTPNEPSYEPIPNRSIMENVSKRGGFATFINIFDKDSNPNSENSAKLIFAGFDFMSKEVRDEYREPGLKRFSAELDRLREQYSKPEWLGAEDAVRRLDALEKYQNSKPEADRAIPFYVDFGVIEVEINLDTANETLKGWINKATAAVDKYLLRMQQNNLPNHTFGSKNPLMDIDTVSKARGAGADSPLFDTALGNSKYVYVAGYPAYDKNTYWVQNNPTNRYDNEEVSYQRLGLPNAKLFNNLKGFVESKIETGNYSIYTSVWRKPMLEWYGFYSNLNFTTIYGGSSGSVAYNEFGQILGIYALTNSSAVFEDLMESGSGYAPLAQNYNISAGTHTVYAFNLIDGSDKSKYPDQARSFRENLAEIYPNGFEDGTFNTALFDNFKTTKTTAK